MSKKIVIDKEDWEKIAQEFNSNDLPKVTEIDTDQSIVDRAERYSHLINKNDEMREFFAYKAGATEQDLISKAREKDKVVCNNHGYKYYLKGDNNQKICYACAEPC